MAKGHKLGWGIGHIVEYDDGTAAFMPSGNLITEKFRVRIADVTGFSESESKLLSVKLNVHGNGAVIATAKVNRGVREAVEKWFRAHPSFQKGEGTKGGAESSGQPVSIADELAKLLRLKEQGHLSEEEFSGLRARLLGM